MRFYLSHPAPRCKRKRPFSYSARSAITSKLKCPHCFHRRHHITRPAPCLPAASLRRRSRRRTRLVRFFCQRRYRFRRSQKPQNSVYNWHRCWAANPATLRPAVAVSTTLFGSSGPGSQDDADTAGFFSGNAADYYDPQNSFIDCVIERRTGIPITLSLMYMAVCEELGLPMVGLNAPAHLLLAPADTSLPFGRSV